MRNGPLACYNHLIMYNIQVSEINCYKLTASHFISFVPPHLSKYSLSVFVRTETSTMNIIFTFHTLSTICFKILGKPADRKSLLIVNSNISITHHLSNFENISYYHTLYCLTVLEGFCFSCNTLCNVRQKTADKKPGRNVLTCQ